MWLHTATRKQTGRPLRAALSFFMSPDPADLVFDPTLACRRVRAERPMATARQMPDPPCTGRGFDASLPLPPQPRVGMSGGQGLLLSRTMLSNHEVPYVGRFACDWHRLATTDPGCWNP